MWVVISCVILKDNCVDTISVFSDVATLHQHQIHTHTDAQANTFTCMQTHIHTYVYQRALGDTSMYIYKVYTHTPYLLSACPTFFLHNFSPMNLYLAIKNLTV